MWLSRIWFLVTLVAAGLLIGAAVTLTGVRDADLAAARDRLAQADARLLVARVGADLEGQSRTAEVIARDPRLQGALDQLQPEMPPHVKRALLDQALSVVSGSFPRLDLVVFGADGTVIGSTSNDTALVDRLAGDPLIADARGQRLQRSGLARAEAGQSGRWVVALPIPRLQDGPPVVLAVVAGPPSTLLENAHAELRAESRLVVFDGDRALEGAVAPAEREAAGKATAAAVGAGAPPSGEAAPPAGPARVEVGEHVRDARRFAVPAVPQLSFVLLWPVDPPTTLATVGGFTGLLDRVGVGLSALPWLAAAGVAWLLGMLFMALGRRRAVRALSEALDALAVNDGRVESVKARGVPRWLGPALRAGVDGAQGLLQRSPAAATSKGPASAATGTHPPAGAAERGDPSAPKSAGEPAGVSRAPTTQSPTDQAVERPEAPAESSTESSVDASSGAQPPPGQGTQRLAMGPGGRPRPASSRSDAPAAAAERSAEESAERSAEESAEKSAERSAEKSAERSAEKSAERSAEKSAERSAEKSAGRPGARGAEASTERAAELSAARPADRSSAPGSGPARAATPPPVPSVSSPVPGLMPELSVPALEDDEIEPEELTDGGIRLPRAPAAGASPPPTPGGDSLLARLRSQNALSPAPRDIEPFDDEPPPEPESPGDRTAVRPIPLELLAASRREEEATVVAGAPEPSPGSPLDLYFHEVYEAFVRTKEQCGETLEGVDYPRFRRKLIRTRTDLLARFDFRDVRFRVYVKDGRAALKAAPLLHEE